MARIPYPEPSQEFTTLSVQLNPFRMLAHAGTTGKRVLSLGNALLSQLELQPKLRELAILQVAHESGADYEWVQHVALARSAGVTQAQILASFMKVLEIDIDEPAGERLLAPPSTESPKGC
jgi:alkylhydroperoxidase family enzyme